MLTIHPITTSATAPSKVRCVKGIVYQWTGAVWAAEPHPASGKLVTCVDLPAPTPTKFEETASAYVGTSMDLDLAMSSTQSQWNYSQLAIKVDGVKELVQWLCLAAGGIVVLIVAVLVQGACIFGKVDDEEVPQ
jgi:hypothetical protein